MAARVNSTAIRRVNRVRLFHAQMMAYGHCRRSGAEVSFLRRSANASREILRWVFPSATLALMPKCPACIVAYIAIATGAGISISTATYLRMLLMVVCAMSLFFLAARRLRGIVRNSSACPPRDAKFIRDGSPTCCPD